MSLDPDDDVRLGVVARTIFDKSAKGVVARLCHDAPHAALGYVLTLLTVLVLTISFKLSDTPSHILMFFGAGLGSLALAAFFKALSQLDQPQRNGLSRNGKASAKRK